jgi:chromosome segregation ATPase
MLLKKKKRVLEPPSYEHPEVSEIKERVKPIDADSDFYGKEGFGKKQIISDRISSTDLPKLSGMKGYDEEDEKPSDFSSSIPSVDAQSGTDPDKRVTMEELETKFSKKMTNDALKERTSKEKQIFIKIDNFKQIVESIENIQKGLEELEGIVSQLEKIKERENEEITESKNNLNDLKDRISDISKNLSEVEG